VALVVGMMGFNTGLQQKQSFYWFCYSCQLINFSYFFLPPSFSPLINLRTSQNFSFTTSRMVTQNVSQIQMLNTKLWSFVQITVVVNFMSPWRKGCSDIWCKHYFWVLLWGYFWKRLAFELVDWAKQMALPNVGGHYPISSGPE
jgi:hypothetical protein